jgi:hypothetical protein
MGLSELFFYVLLDGAGLRINPVSAGIVHVARRVQLIPMEGERHAYMLLLLLCNLEPWLEPPYPLAVKFGKLMNFA